MRAGRICRKRILVADDEPAVRDALKMLLKIDEHTVTEARDGAEALDLVAQGKFDLVITDYEMPRMKGSELAVRVKKLCPARPILMITAYAERLGNAENPVDAILNKPFAFNDLRRAIAQLLS
jgi:CheY-like chemotaxis protein